MTQPLDILVSGHITLKAHHTKPVEDENVGLDEILIIMVHGFPGSQTSQQNLFPSFERKFAEKGFHSLRFDFRGCGESDGEPEDFTIKTACEDFQAVLAWARDHHYKRFMYVGEGLGAAISLINQDENMACMALLWPVLDFKHLVQKVFEIEEIEDQWKKAGYMVYGENRVSVDLIEELTKPDIVSALEHTDIPLLIMHGSDDSTAPIDRLDLIRGHAKSRRIEITSFQNGKHGLPDQEHRSMMRYHLLQFILKYP